MIALRRPASPTHLPSDVKSPLRNPLLAILLTAVLVSAAAAKDASRDARVAARVNAEVVLHDEVHQLLKDTKQREQLLRELAKPDATEKQLRDLALRKLVQRRLLLQEASRRHLTVTEREIDQAVTSLRRAFEDLRSFGEWLQSRGLNEQTLFDRVRSDALLARVTGFLVQGSQVSEEELRRYYDAHTEELKSEEVWLHMIVAKDRAEAEAVQAATKTGIDFGTLARRQSLGRHAAEGGDLGWRGLESLPAALKEAVSALDPGEAIGPLPKEDGTFAIVRLEQRRTGRPKTFAEARSEIARRLIATKQETVLQAWLADQERQSQIQLFDR